MKLNEHPIPLAFGVGMLAINCARGAWLKAIIIVGLIVGMEFVYQYIDKHTDPQ